jgi:Icc-related predicted phosphoesterase
MKSPSTLTKDLPDLPLYFVGDHHGDWGSLLTRIDHHKLDNCILYSVGDVGIGFQPRANELAHMQTLNEMFQKKNIVFLAIRGNHDDPSFFNSPTRPAHSHFELLPDYSILTHRGLTIQGVGGAVSIDRCERWPGTSYWYDEGVCLVETLLQKVDILVTHNAPPQCFPQGHNEIVKLWVEKDPSLLKDLQAERLLLKTILEKTQPRYHFYGHFHASHREETGGCRHTLLNICEMCPSPSNPPPLFQ